MPDFRFVTLRFVTLTITLFLFASASKCIALAVSLDWVTVGDAGNNADAATSFGSVEYEYRIGKYEVTVEQYVEFLNSVASVDANGVYDILMTESPIGSVNREGDAGSYRYTPKSRVANFPMPHVSFWNALRFTNWLQNGKPVGFQTENTTEDGAYTLTTDGVVKNSMHRNPDAKIYLPNDDEWYKAAYYKRGGIESGYWLYPTQSDVEPIAEKPPGGVNSANHNDKFGRKSEVGSYADSPGPYDTFDQAGNVWEWTEAVVIVDDQSHRATRGGSFFLNDANSLASTFQGHIDPSQAYGVQGFRVASLIPPTCDFTDDFRCDAVDISLLIQAFGTENEKFNVDRLDPMINEADRDAWPSVAGELAFGETFKLGDVNLDGVVDPVDLNVIGLNWLSDDVSGWSAGDFNGDRRIDASDLNAIGASWLSDIRPSTAAIPEPRASCLVIFALALLGAHRCRIRA